MRSMMHAHNQYPGINEESIHLSSLKYADYKLKDGHAIPLGEGILIWDETKVYSHVNLIPVNC